MDIVSSVGSYVANSAQAFFNLWINLNLPPEKDRYNNVHSKNGGGDADENGEMGGGAENGSGFDRKLFECANCGDIPHPPVYTCTLGHIVCEKCREALKSCSNLDCEEDLNGSLRNLLVESFVTSATFPCKFHDDGCPKLFQGSVALSQHQVSCFHRHVKCGVTHPKSCDGNWEGSVQDLYAHLLSTHQMEFIFRDRKITMGATFDSNSNSPNSNNFLEFIEPGIFLKVKNVQNFIIRPIFNKEENSVFIFVTGFYRNVDDLLHASGGKIQNQVAGGSNSEEGKRTFVGITWKRKAAILSSECASTKREYVWIGPVNSVYDSVEDIVLERNGLWIPWTELFLEASIVSDTAKWDVDIEIFPENQAANNADASSCRPTESGKGRNTKQVPEKFWGILRKGSLPWFLRPFFATAWSIVAPLFTICLMLFFVFFV